MPLELPLIATERLVVRPALQDDVPEIVKYYQDNRTFLAPFEPTRPDNFFTPGFWQEQVDKNLIEFNYSQALRFFLFKKNSRTIIGTANFTQFIYGAAESCVLGYNLAKIEQGKGYMSEALQATIQYLFEGLNLHRVTANYMPHNRRSGNLLRRLGFVVEGYARDYLLIDGKWEDHVLTSLTNPVWKADWRAKLIQNNPASRT
jgi:ribosomal-protein-alanine N-acetyltransferase